MEPINSPVITRAEASLGGSSMAIYRRVAQVLARRHPGGGLLLDIGCGCGDLRAHVSPHVSDYVGADVIRYERFPSDARFFQIDLDAGRVPLPDAAADIVIAVETIEHLENPRAFFRELKRLVRPGGLVIVTTPNQLSLLSKLSLVLKNQFNAFQEAPGLYPAHITALLEMDLTRIARENNFTEVETVYSGRGRIPFTSRHWPHKLGGRWFSDNIILAARRPI